MVKNKTSAGTAMRTRKRLHRDILVPTDGSPPSRRAAREGARLARKLGARMIGLHVITPFEVLPYREGPVLTIAELRQRAGNAAEGILATVKKAAAAEKVECICRAAWDSSASNGILTAARAHRCGYIVMATHGRRGLRRILLGSVTQQVLAASRIPVLVCQ